MVSNIFNLKDYQIIALIVNIFYVVNNKINEWMKASTNSQQ